MNTYTYPYPKYGKTLIATKEALIQALKDMDEKTVEELDPNTRKLFDAIMRIADERDALKHFKNKLKLFLKEHENDLIMYGLYDDSYKSTNLYRNVMELIKEYEEYEQKQK